MRGYVPAFDLAVPRTLKKALDLLAEGGTRPFAGGTDLMVLFEAGRLEPGTYVSLWGVDALRGVEVRKGEVRVGALTTYSEIRRHPVLQKEYPLLVEAARLTGAIAIQNRGTLGGNLANASPAADSPPALLIYEAVLELASRSGVRRVPYSEFHLGYKKTALWSGEIIQSICLPRSKKRGHEQFRKVGTRGAQAISKVSFAGSIRGRRTVESIRLAVGSVAPIPIRCVGVESLLLGKRLSPDLIHEAGERLGREISPIDDVRSTGAYRRAVAAALVRDFLEHFSGGA